MKGADQCPKCASRRTADIANSADSFYAAVIRVCANCKTAWEPVNPSDLLDKDIANSSLLHPCDNCAFRKGSPEQADKDEWQSKLFSLERGGSFYCHKGAPITPGKGHGFAYPDPKVIARKGRLCRGFLNSCVGKQFKHYEESQAAIGDQAETPWIDELVTSA